MENQAENTFNIDTAEILFGRHSRSNEELFLKMRAVIEQQAQVIKQYQERDTAETSAKATGTKKG